MLDNLAQPNQKKWHGITPGASFADGGAVEDDVAGAIPDDSGGAPVAQAEPQPQQGGIPDDDSGGAPVAPQDPQQPQSRSGVDFDASHVPANAKRIIQYLMGGPAGGGADQETAEKFAKPDKHKGLSDDDANLLAVQHAAEMGGPAAAFALIQYNRGAYNAKAAFAKAAMNGVDGKAGDVASAADAATKASAHMLDGSSVHYRPSGDNVVATVKMPGTTQEQHLLLNAQQFTKAIDPMGEGQYDKVLEQGGTAAHLARMAKFQAAHPAPDSEAVRTGQPIAKDVTEGDQPAIPGTHDAHGHYLGPKEPDQTNYGDEAEARSTAIFGKGNVNAEPARQQWMNAQEEKGLERENKVAVAAEKGKNDIKKAEIMGGARVQSSQQHSDALRDVANTRSDAYKYSADKRSAGEDAKMAAKLAQIAQSSNDKALAQKASTLRTLVMNPQYKMTKAQEAEINNITAAAPQAPTPQAQTPQAQAPQAQAPQAAPTKPPVAGAKFFNGHWYTAGPKGPDGKRAAVLVQ